MRALTTISKLLGGSSYFSITLAALVRINKKATSSDELVARIRTYLDLGHVATAHHDNFTCADSFDDLKVREHFYSGIEFAAVTCKHDNQGVT